MGNRNPSPGRYDSARQKEGAPVMALPGVCFGSFDSEVLHHALDDALRLLFG